jgi:UDP-N-acetylglucosamine diphosphorylase/glucosamine-1-phosphate N-acetyltransferase
MRLCVFEDAAVADLEPLTLTRPAFDLRCGAATLLERQRRLFPGCPAGVLVRPFLAPLCRLSHPDLAVNDAGWLRGQRLALVNARWLAPPALSLPEGDAVGLVGDRVAFVLLSAFEAGRHLADDWPWRLAEWRTRLPRLDAGGVLVDHPWELLDHNADALADDLAVWRTERPETAPPPGLMILGPVEHVRLDPTAAVEPQVLIDARSGPVLLDAGVKVQAFSRIEGPCFVGAGSQVFAARLRGNCSVGPDCRVGGEVEASILHGHVNKYHEGFLGHSYSGEWVNFGAGTQASDLRNDYGAVQLSINGRRADTGRIKIGCFLGDFTRSGIGTLLNTGTVVGPFGQLLPSGGYLPRSVPAFCTASLGRIQERTDLGQMFATAATMMGRRGQTWTETHAEFYLGLYERTEAERRQALLEGERRRVRRVV